MQGNTRKINVRQREQRRRAKRRRRIAFFLWQCVLLLAIAVLAWKIGRYSKAAEFSYMQEESKAVLENAWGDNGIEGADYIEQVGVVAVDTPVKRTAEEVLLRLEELSAQNEKVKQVLENKSAYPDNMLEALANNPEMVDFVLGYLTAEQAGDCSLTEREKKTEHPLFLQWDPRWGYVSYGDNSCVGLAGCGPTCLSMALYELTGDESLTPDFIAEYAMKHDYYMFGTGTQWALMDEVPVKYGIHVDKPGIDENTMKQRLDEGCVLICAMRPGDFTAGGHFIVIYGYDENGFLVNDPNCVARSRQSWEFERIAWQMKQLWALGK